MRAISLHGALIMATRSPRFWTPYLFACALALFALSGLWYGIGQPVALPDVVSATHKLQCASYSPFGKDQSPFDQSFTLRPEQMDQDLALLAKQFHCVRTYSMTGLEDLPALARKHGLKLLLGAWVNANPTDTERELNLLVKAANANPDVVEALVVGNETLLRKEVTGAHLAQLIEQVKAQVTQPVTYADVWEFWLKHPEVAPAVDFITIHLLPYWEDQPRSSEAALRHVAKIRNEFVQRFAPKEILIGETGWPSEGRQRETARPSRVNEAQFIRGFVQMAEAGGWRYNLIEAFDQPWKRQSEGAVGGYWGLFDADRNDKGVLSGPVSNLPNWPAWLGLSLALWLATLLLAGKPRSPAAALLLPLAAALGAGALGLWLELAAITSRYLGEWLFAGALALLNLLVLGHLAGLLGSVSGVRGRLSAWLAARGGWWLMAGGFAGALLMIELVFDARYRSFPSMALLLPALFYALRPQPIARNEGYLLTGILLLGSLAQLYQETWRNPDALGWAAVALLLAVAVWRSARLKAA